MVVFCARAAVHGYVEYVGSFIHVHLIRKIAGGDAGDLLERRGIKECHRVAVMLGHRQQTPAGRAVHQLEIPWLRLLPLHPRPKVPTGADSARHRIDQGN